MARTAAALLAFAAFAAEARADEKKFAFSYEAKTLPEGALEFEQWITMRNARREGDFRLLQMRTEIEYGLKDRLTTSLYFNYETESFKDVPGLKDEHETDFEGVSNEWKYKVTDPTADPIGLLLYGELGIGSKERELELKLIANKRLGPLNLVCNLIVEFEQEKEKEPSGETEWEKESALIQTVGVSYEVDPRVALGLEGMAVSGYSETFEQRESLAYFVGPNLSVVFGRWWATLTALRQVDLRPEGHGLDLDANEKLQVRLVVGLSW